jgi:hypothetical protein
MPIVSIFLGIIIRLYHDDHNPPHLHASYGEFEALIEIKSGKLIRGKLPTKAKRLVEEWRRAHLLELQNAWNDVVAMKVPRRIKGLE